MGHVQMPCARSHLQWVDGVDWMQFVTQLERWRAGSRPLDTPIEIVVWAHARCLDGLMLEPNARLVVRKQHATLVRSHKAGAVGGREHNIHGRMCLRVWRLVKARCTTTTGAPTRMVAQLKTRSLCADAAIGPVTNDTILKWDLLVAPEAPIEHVHMFPVAFDTLGRCDEHAAVQVTFKP